MNNLAFRNARYQGDTSHFPKNSLWKFNPLKKFNSLRKYQRKIVKASQDWDAWAEGQANKFEQQMKQWSEVVRHCFTLYRRVPRVKNAVLCKSPKATHLLLRRQLQFPCKTFFKWSKKRDLAYRTFKNWNLKEDIIEEDKSSYVFKYRKLQE